MDEVTATHVTIAMFKPPETSRLYQITVTHDPHKITHFEHFLSDGKESCGINRASFVTEVGILDDSIDLTEE
jgi:hypothetical protein